ncbi:PHP domain-containing protein [Clostridium gasigenes]|uniref:PHP domain-containing protein n=1 Tax=Clostridium gasigenes TaxID=94869 RepID=UPI001C0B8BA4|nr:PHP domain-containing protein [Clostridium gasigenes]MBU3106260.1 PHP domain-containing protein [Clostridium gasigenes]
MSIYDLHTHSTSSDGKFSPRDVVKQGFENGVKYLALTDHDTVSGISEASEEAKKLGITLIPGIELSTEHNGESIHILGFFKGDDYKNPELLEILDKIKQHRIERAYKIVEKLEKYFKITLDINKVLAGGTDTITRPHIAKAIIYAGYPYDTTYIFNNIIGNDCRAYVASTKMSTEEGIGILKRFNAFAFLAHPIYIKKTPLKEMLKFDFDGIEALYAQNTEEQTNNLLEIVKTKKLFTSCGSDCHGVLNDPRHSVIGEIYINPIIPIDELLNWVTSLK